jgi:hypothetical protein
MLDGRGPLIVSGLWSDSPLTSFNLIRAAIKKDADVRLGVKFDCPGD